MFTGPPSHTEAVGGMPNLFCLRCILTPFPNPAINPARYCVLAVYLVTSPAFPGETTHRTYMHIKELQEIGSRDHRS